MSTTVRCAAFIVLWASLASAAAEKSDQPAGAGGIAPPPETVGAKAPQSPPPPAKAVDEPVFQLPELVIIGENRARIMAQKEALAGSPLQGLHEAPLLEKEESSVTALRRREPAAVTEPSRTGTGFAVRVEGGGSSLLGGGIWAGRQSRNSTWGIDADASTLGGEEAGGGHAGGAEGGGAVSGGWTGRPPKWLSWISLGADPDLIRAAAGAREQSRDLPWFAADPGATRRLTRAWAAGDASRVSPGWSLEERLEIVHLRTPVASAGAVGAAGRGSIDLLRRESMAVRLVPRAEFEFADFSGDHFLAGGTLEAAWVPTGRLRAGFGGRVDGVFGGRVFAGSARPVGGAAWDSPWGPEVAAAFDPGLSAPWLSRLAADSPYSVFGARLVPVRELANLEVAVRQGWWRGDEARISWRFTSARDALSWAEIPGAGLFAPAALPGLSVHEFAASGRWAGMKPLSVTARVRARSVSASGGSMANLPRAEGGCGAEYAWRTLRGGLAVEFTGSRPRSVTGGGLGSFAAVGAFVAWAPKPRLEIGLRADNLGGARVERWAGYPEPRRLVTLSARAAF